MNDDYLIEQIRFFFAACVLRLRDANLPIRVYTVLEDVLKEEKDQNLFAERFYSPNQHFFLKALSLAYKARYIEPDGTGLVAIRISPQEAARIQYERGFRDAELIANEYLRRLDL